jgi:hypothetical protein
MNTDPYMTQLAHDYRIARELLLSHRSNKFQHRKMVRVDCSRYHGIGVVTSDEACPADQVPVLLGNGNTWWYPVESVSLTDEPMTRELRHAILDSAQIGHA